ncbi:unnamed protein product, partial [Alternaria alternata]
IERFNFCLDFRVAQARIFNLFHIRSVNVRVLAFKMLFPDDIITVDGNDEFE